MAKPPPAPSSLAQRLIDTLPARRGEREALRALLSVADDAHKVRTTFGILMRLAADARDPSALSLIRPLVDETLRSPLGMVSAAEASAFSVAVGHALYPDAPLIDAGNLMLERAITAHDDFPMLKTLRMACGHDWDRFLRDYTLWAELVWNVEASLTRTGPQSATLWASSVSARFVSIGFWRGFMHVFGLDGRCDVEEMDGNDVRIQLTWWPKPKPA